MNPADVRYRDHTEAAVELLARAGEIEKGPRCHLAKTYAAMASVHAALASNALVELVHTPIRLVAPEVSTESDTPLPLDTATWVVPR